LIIKLPDGQPFSLMTSQWYLYYHVWSCKTSLILFSYKYIFYIRHGFFYFILFDLDIESMNLFSSLRCLIELQFASLSNNLFIVHPLVSAFPKGIWHGWSFWIWVENDVDLFVLQAILKSPSPSISCNAEH